MPQYKCFYALFDCRCSRQNPFHLKVYLDADGRATGDLFWDDGDSIGCYHLNILRTLDTIIDIMCL